MDEVNQSNPEANNNSETWKILTPEEFIRLMLHELRNPIMVIKGYTALLSNEEAKEHHPLAIEAISRNTEKLEVLLKEIANYYSYIRSNSNPEP